MKNGVLFHVTAAVSGVIFGIGLAIARMTDPQKVRDFLDLAAIPDGGWDPSLAFVMGGGVLVGLVGLRLDRLLRKPVAAVSFVRSDRSGIDGRLLLGSAIFGVGWGLSGFCPGPAVADLGLIPQSVFIFVVAMFAASWATGIYLHRRDHDEETAAHAAPG